MDEKSLEEEEEKEVQFWNDMVKGDPKTARHLSDALQDELRMLLKKNLICSAIVQEEPPWLSITLRLVMPIQ